MKIAQLVWSPGFVWPGGSDLALELTKPLGLDASATMLEIGSGLGGSARAIAGTLGTYVTGFDLDPRVAEEAMRQTAASNLEERTKVLPLEEALPNLRKDFFRAAMVRETLYRVGDKKALLGPVLDALKKDQTFVLFDLFAGNAKPSKALADWIALEPHPVHLWRAEELSAFLRERRVEIRVEQDDSEAYCAMAVAAWNRFVGGLAGAGLAKPLIGPLVREVELWARRTAALQSGDLKVWRYVGIKHTEVT